ncbi:MAG TPA: DUF2092 domain-containing protein [Polyangia bacterium]|nr:DUF2092 domain-containing protein [Polyangia bacterium]
MAVRTHATGTTGGDAMKKMLLGAAVLVGLLALATAPRLGARQASAAAKASKSGKGISAEADSALRKMTDYLASLQSFRVRSAAKDEVVLKSGQKIDLASQSETSVQRPNKLRSEQVGAKGGLAFWYDGKSMTLECQSNGTYTTKPAPPDIDGAIDQARKQFGIEAPGADLLYSKPYDILTEQVTGGQLIGHETVEGEPVTHLAFRGEEVDWQIWIKDGKEPLPVWFSIITKTLPSQPEFEVHLSHWETKVSFPAATFAFKAPPNGTSVDHFPKTCSPPTTAER